MIADARVTGLVEPGGRGRWRVERFTVGRRDLEVQLGGLFGTGRTVPPGEYTRLMSGGSVVMSDTPDELRDISEVLYRGTGRVLVNGLGLGCVVKGLLGKLAVTHVDVVEVDADVIALVGRYYAGPRCTIRHADAFKAQWPARTRWDCCWHDIWTDLCADDLAEHTKLRRKYGRRCDWQGSWGWHFLRRRR